MFKEKPGLIAFYEPTGGRHEVKQPPNPTQRQGVGSRIHLVGHGVARLWKGIGSRNTVIFEKSNVMDRLLDMELLHHRYTQF